MRRAELLAAVVVEVLRPVLHLESVHVAAVRAALALERAHLVLGVGNRIEASERAHFRVREISKPRRADRAGNVRIRRHHDLPAKHGLIRRDHALVERDRALERDLLADLPAADVLVEVVLHAREADPRREVLDRHVVLLVVDHRGLGKHRAGPVQIGRASVAQRHIAELLQRYPQPRGLLFQERAGARRAGLVHLEIYDDVAVEANILAVLAADLEDRVDIVRIRQRAAGLSGDLVADQLGADVVGSQVSATARGRRGDLADLVAAFIDLLLDLRKRVSHGRKRVAIGAAIVAREHHELAIDLGDHGSFRAHGADVHAQRGAFDLRQRAKSRERRARDIGPFPTIAYCLLPKAYWCAARVFQRPLQMLFEAVDGVTQIDFGLRPHRRADGSEGAVMLGHEQSAVQTELLGEESHHRRVLRDAADERDLVPELLAARDCRAVVAADGLMDSRGDPVARGAFLVEMRNIGLGKDRAAA